MNWREWRWMLVAIGLTGCAANPSAEFRNECEAELAGATRELQAARELGLAGEIDWIKGANLAASAGHHLRAKRYDVCLKKARRARVFIHAAGAPPPIPDEGTDP